MAKLNLTLLMCNFGLTYSLFRYMSCLFALPVHEQLQYEKCLFCSIIRGEERVLPHGFSRKIDTAWSLTNKEFVHQDVFRLSLSVRKKSL